MIDVTVEEPTTGDGSAGIRTVRLDRPEARNALTPDALDELERAVTEADEPVVYLTGVGGSFSAGADLDVVSRLSPEDARDFAAHGQRVARSIERADAVVVAGIDGHCLGGGLELALAADVRVATPASTFGEPGVTFGLFGAWGGTGRLPTVVGRGHAADLIASGRTIDAETALEMGLISRIVEEPRTVAVEIAGNPPETLAAVAPLLRGDPEGTAESRTRHEGREAEAFAELVDVHEDALRRLRE